MAIVLYMCGILLYEYGVKEARMEGERGSGSFKSALRTDPASE